MPISGEEKLSTFRKRHSDLPGNAVRLAVRASSGWEGERC
jgi:hypothetical protein